MLYRFTRALATASHRQTPPSSSGFGALKADLPKVGNQLNGYLAQRAPSLFLASSSRTCLNCALLKVCFPRGLGTHQARFLYTCIYIYIYTYLSISIYLSIYIYIYIYLSLSLYIYIYMYLHIYIYLSLSIYIYISLSSRCRQGSSSEEMCFVTDTAVTSKARFNGQSTN